MHEPHDFLHQVKMAFKHSALAPRYIQLATGLEEVISSGGLSAGDFLPPERVMAEALQLSRVTISKALAVLEEKQLISRLQGIGTRINPQIHYSLINEAGFTAHVIRHGGSVSNQWLLRCLIPACAKVAKFLGLAVDTQVAKLRRLRLMDGEPVSLETTYMPMDFLPEPEKVDESLYALWQSRGINPDKKQFNLKALACSADMAELLHVEPGTPLLRIQQISRDAQGNILEFSETLCRSDIYELEVWG